MTEADRPEDEVYLSVDIEAAGPIPATYSLLSLGACVVGDPAHHFYAELQPINDNVVPEALAVSGFSLETLKERAEDPATAMHRFDTWIRTVSGDRKPVFVGFNACFDWAFINWYFLTFVGKNPFGFSALDIKAYYMGLSGCRWSETASSRLPQQYQPDSGAPVSHNALEDARVQGEIFGKLLAAVSIRGSF